MKYPIIILPGWLLAARRYHLLAKKLTHAGYKTHIVDFPGFGNTSPLDRVYQLTDYVHFLKGYLEKEKITQAIFIAHSFGGRVILKLVNENPSIARAIIFSGTPGFPPVPTLKRMTGLILAKVGNVLTLIPPFLFFREPLRKFLYKLTGAHDFSRATGYTRETFKHIVKEDLANYMKSVKVTTLLLWGEEDKIVRPEIAQKMHQVIAHSEIKIVSGEKHMFPSTNPDLFTKHVLEFVKNL